MAAIMVTLSGWGNVGVKRDARDIEYVIAQSEAMYVSHAGLMNLGVIPKSFPSVGSWSSKVWDT